MKIGSLMTVAVGVAIAFGLGIPFSNIASAQDIITTQTERVQVSPSVIEYRESMPVSAPVYVEKPVMLHSMEKTIEKTVVVEKTTHRSTAIRSTSIRRSVASRPVYRPRHIAYVARPRRTMMARSSTAISTTTERVVEKPVMIEKPVFIERPVLIDRPVVVEKRVYVDRLVERTVMVEKPVVIERPVMVEKVIERPAVQRVIERPVVIEKQVEQPVIIERRVRDHHLLRLGLPIFHVDAF